MLTIRNEQIAAFQKQADLTLSRELAARMRAAWPGPCDALADDQLLKLCLDGILDSRHFGLRLDRSIARFLNLRFAVGHQFPAGDDGAHAILTNRKLSEEQRLNYLVARLSRGIGAHAVIL